MKTLITVANEDLRQLVFREEAVWRLERVTEVDFVELGDDLTVAQLADRIAGYEAVLTSWRSPKLTQQVLERADRLRFVGHAAGTVVPIVDPVIFDRDPETVVVNANSPLARSTAELVMALMMAGGWTLNRFADQMRRGVWRDVNQQTVIGLYGQTIGLIGYGEISREVIRLLQPFHATILLCSRNCPEEEAASLGVQLCGLEELLRRSTIVSLHNTLTEKTQGMIGREQLALMQDGALFVNTARGPIVQEQALLDELESGRLYAALDVFHAEPVQVDSPLLRLPNVVCTPHIGAMSRYWRGQLGETVIDELIRFVNGEPLQGRITREKFAFLTPQ
ncbi:hydroxyacid dehydrogenase [Paenibacillus koleovorans]|uniref:hydroxyacid dehydrogenase n=1 Tax=Paenibacillus koleovorans TaxID=121608 RepID=UPI000FDB4FDC|nr:hydroxyacid dehydrogenase [Paenibacillus koleovorans]